MGSEPQSLQLALYAWALAHVTPSKGNHDAADACKYAVTRECDFKISYAPKENAEDSEFSSVAPILIPADPANPMIPSAVVVIPLNGTPPVVVKIVATPTKKVKIQSAHGEVLRPGVLREVRDAKTEDGFYPGTAWFVYKGAGVWVKKKLSQMDEEENCATHFSNPVVLAATTPVPFTFGVVAFFLSRVRDRTIKARQARDSTQTTRNDWIPPSVDFKSVKDPPIEKGRVVFSTSKVDLDSDFRVLEVKGFNGPSLLAVHWPRKNYPKGSDTQAAPGFRADPMESFIFFHASYSQNAQIYTKHPYPYGNEYIYFGIENYEHPSDPLEEAYPLSIPYQIAAAKKQTVFILPVNRVGFPELPNLNFPEQVVEIWEEIHAAFLRFADFYYWLPNVGRIGIASFSAGIQELLMFRSGAVSHPLLKSLLQEIYVFDPVHSDPKTVAEYANGLKSWAGNVPERRVRVYNNQSGDGHESFLGVGRLPVSPYVIDSKNNRLTSGVVSDTDWLNANEGMNAYKFVPRRNLFVSILTKPITAGDLQFDLESTDGLRVNDPIVINLFIHRVKSISGKTIHAGEPIESDFDKGSRIGKFLANSFKTTLAADAPKGAATVKVTSADGLDVQDPVMLAESEVRRIEAVNGNDLTLSSPLTLDRKQGDPVEKFEHDVATLLAAETAAGSNILNVFTGKGAGFSPGDTITIGKEEFIKITGVTDTSLTLAKPISKDYKKKTLIGKMEPRVLDWGIYHAMFVSVFITDAMRKSGFK